MAKTNEEMVDAIANMVWDMEEVETLFQEWLKERKMVAYIDPTEEQQNDDDWQYSYAAVRKDFCVVLMGIVAKQNWL